MLSGLALLSGPALALSAPDNPGFPESLQGQWTSDPSACGNEDTTGMRISGESIAFYEATGWPSVIRTGNDGAITAEIAYKGEGRMWTATDHFTLSADRRSVHVDAMGKSFRLQRCPAR
ncbi:MAG: hypothetical protein ABW184_02580 [Sphingobium sp.]